MICQLSFHLLVILVVHFTSSQLVTNQDNGPTSFHPVPANINCWLLAKSGYRDRLTQYLKNGAKVIELNIILVDHPPDMLHQVLENVYRPYHWVRTTSRKGRNLLMLEENYNEMSLSTLTIGVESLQVNLTDTPVRCLRGLGEQETLHVIRHSILRDFTDPASGVKGSITIDEHICNTHVVGKDGHGEFIYTCCYTDQEAHVICQDIEKDEWMKALLTLVVIIKVVVVLYSPLFLPESLYRTKYLAAQYIYHVGGPPVSLKMVVTQDPDQFGEVNHHKTVRLSNLKNMEYLKTMVSSWVPERIYDVKVKDVRLSVKTRRLLDNMTVPVTVLKLLYNNLIRCRIRKLEPLRACCETNILGRFNPGLKKIMKWYELMKIFAGLCMAVIIAIPWIIRSAAYYKYEAPMIEGKRQFASSKGLGVSFSGSIVRNLSPVHGFFVIIYIIFIVDFLVYGIISRSMKEKFKLVMRQCLRDMRERSRIAVLAWMLKLIVMPFRVFGLLGLLLFIPYLVVIFILTLPFVAFYIFPTVNLTIRLIIHLFMFLCPKRIAIKVEELSDRLADFKERLKIREVTAQESFVKKHQFTTAGIILQLIVISMCLVSFWALTLLLMEVISFFVEILIYTFMGIIVNAGITMQYVSVALLVALYCKSIFARLRLLYQHYHQIIQKQLLIMKREEIREVAKKEALDQENTAFVVQGDSEANKLKHHMPKIKVKNHQPQWQTSGMLVFLDNYDTLYTPEKFFYESITLNYFGCPGPIYHNVNLALWELLKIILFLIFILLVVMAFGDAYHISTTNQLLATVVGGFVPFIFRYLFNSDASVTSFDSSSIQFQTEFHKAINGFRQAWTVFDILPAAVKEWDGNFDDVIDGNGSVSNQPVPGNEEAATSGAHHLSTSSDSVSNTDEVTPHSAVYIDDETPNVDIIVDISTPKTRTVNSLLKKGFEGGSMSMLDRVLNKSGKHKTTKTIVV